MATKLMKTVIFILLIISHGSCDEAPKIHFTRPDCIISLDCPHANFYEWHYNDDTEILSQSKIFNLTIRSLKDSGRYICKAIGGHLNIIREHLLRVIPSLTELDNCNADESHLDSLPMFLEEFDQKYPKRLKNIVTGSSLDLDCTALYFSPNWNYDTYKNSPPKFLYRWTFDQEYPPTKYKNQLAPLYNNGLGPENYSILKLRNVSVHHSGLYKCSVILINESTPLPHLNRKFLLTVIEPDQPIIRATENDQIEVEIGSEYEMHCPVNTDQFKIIGSKWFKYPNMIPLSNTKQKNSDFILYFPQIRADDAGNYTCIVESHLQMKDRIDRRIFVVSKNSNLPETLPKPIQEKNLDPRIFIFAPIAVVTVCFLIICIICIRRRNLRRKQFSPRTSNEIPKVKQPFIGPSTVYLPAVPQQSLCKSSSGVSSVANIFLADSTQFDLPNPQLNIRSSVNLQLYQH